MKRNNLNRERRQLEERQEFLRTKLQKLVENYDEETRIYEKALEGGKLEQAEIALKGLERTEKLIEQTESEYNDNFARIEQCSKISKTDGDKANAVVGTAAGIGATIGSLMLGKMALDRAYESDKEGSMTNKKTLDFFYKLNPIRILGFIKKQ